MSWFKVTLCLGILTSIFAWLLLSSEINPVAYNVSPTTPLPSNDAAYISDRLSDMRAIPVEPYHGAESLVHFDGSLYTGVAEGKILRMNDSGVFVFANIAPVGCATLPECGRPLGMRLSLDEKSLLVADAYLGLFTVRLEDGEVEHVFPKTKHPIKPVFFDDFDILPNGSVILSEASTHYPLHLLIDLLCDATPDGRLLMIDLETGEWRTIMDGLYFPNGVQLHADGRSVLVVETTTFRVLRIPLDGGGPASVFADGLPGIPDNIRKSPRGGYWVPVSSLRGDWLTDMFANLSQWPQLRRLLHKLLKLFPRAMKVEPFSSMLIRLNDTGHVVEAWKDASRRVRNAVEVCEIADRFYISSYFLPYIGDLKIL